MQTLLLHVDEVLNFNSFLCEPNITNLNIFNKSIDQKQSNDKTYNTFHRDNRDNSNTKKFFNQVVNSTQPVSSLSTPLPKEATNLMALQYYLKHPGYNTNIMQSSANLPPLLNGMAVAATPIPLTPQVHNMQNTTTEITTGTLINENNVNVQQQQLQPPTSGLMGLTETANVTNGLMTYKNSGNSNDNVVGNTKGAHYCAIHGTNNIHTMSISQQTQHQHQFLISQLKQPTNSNNTSTHHSHHHGMNNYHHSHHNQHHHHPYYQQHQNSTHSLATNNSHYISTALNGHSHHCSSHNHSQNPLHNHHINNYNIGTRSHNYSQTVPVHALNQNSNFSAASSSTGGGTSSSHAPTQQSNATGSSLSPPQSSSSARTTPASASSSASSTSSNSGSGGAHLRNSLTNITKKIKTEPVLSHFHQSERLTFATNHFDWTEDHWTRVVFHDERKFNLDGPDGFSYYFHDLRNSEHSLSQRPRGNSVFVYIMITSGGPIHLEIGSGKIKMETCIETIIRERTTIATKLGGFMEFILQDYNWTANAMPNIAEFLSTEGIQLQKWPTIAHDLNIMEDIWGWLVRDVFDGGRKFSRKDDLIFRIRESWNRLPDELITNLYTTLPERIMQLCCTRGAYTNC